MSKTGWSKDHADSMYGTIQAAEPIDVLTCPCCGDVGDCVVSNPTAVDENRHRCHYGCARCDGKWSIVWDNRTNRPTLEGEPR